jgi:hypothetical protein
MNTTDEINAAEHGMVRRGRRCALLPVRLAAVAIRAGHVAQYQRPPGAVFAARTGRRATAAGAHRGAPDRFIAGA